VWGAAEGSAPEGAEATREHPALGASQCTCGHRGVGRGGGGSSGRQRRVCLRLPVEDLEFEFRDILAYRS